MASINKCILIGNLGADPTTRYAASGSAICNVSLATSREWKDRNTGEKQSEVEWHKVVFYDRLAEVVGEYLKKGSPMYVEGRLKTRKWQDKDGIDRYTTEIVAESMQMLGNKQDTQQQSRPNAYANASGGRAAPAFNDMNDDIPF